jgi:V/A-type H+-transporting ATPase subunit C
VSGGGLLGYAAVHARTRAMYAAKLSGEVWANLCQASSFAALIDALKETVYGPHLVAVDAANLTPRRAVYQIKIHLAEAFVALLGLTPEPARSLLTQVYRLYEVDNLKAVLRGLVAGASWDQVRYVLFPLGSFTVLPAEAMAEAESVEAAIEALRGTPYYDTLAHAVERYSSERSLFPLEVALDLGYWRELWSDISRLSSQDRAPSLRVLGTMVDVNNLMWAIRYRVYHHLAEEEIINYTLPFGYQVQDEDIRAIAAGADIALVIERIYPDLTDVANLLQEPRTGVPLLELELQRHIIERCREVFLGSPFHTGIPLAYLVLNELEIQDLTVVIEAKSLQVPIEVFEPRLLTGCGAE